MGTVYLIPSILHEEGIEALPAYILETVKQCQVLFVENLRTTRRYLKMLSREIVIDNFEWVEMEAAEPQSRSERPYGLFKQYLLENKNIGIISEAGCPGIADPGQALVAIAQEMNVTVKPLVGPNSLLLALMASGMNGQQFQFWGYLPVKDHERTKAIRQLETESQQKDCTQLFIETPYRNNQMLDAILKTAKPSTQLCLAVDLTAENEWVKTKTIAEWKKEIPDIHKRPAIFLLYARV